MTTWKAGFAQIDITPQNPVRLQGMAGEPRVTATVADPLAMQVLILEDLQGTKVLFIAADLFAFDPDFVAAVSHMAEKRGIKPEAVLLNASHTHYGPGTLTRAMPSLGGTECGFLDDLKHRVETVLMHLETEPCRLYHGSTSCQIGFNRRLSSNGQVTFGPNPEGYVHRATPFLVLEKTNGQQILMVNHGCHPTGMGSQTLISADYPGALRRALCAGEKVIGAMFLQGAGADVKQIVLGTGQFCQRWADAADNGRRLAETILAGLSQVEPIEPGYLCARRRQVRLCLQVDKQVPELDKMVADPDCHPWEKEWAQALIANTALQDPTVNLPLHVLAIGEGPLLVAMGGEPVAGLAPAIQELADHPQNVWVLGYTNGLAAYLPTLDVLQEGGYEVDATRLVYLRAGILDGDAPSHLQAAIDDCMAEVSEMSTGKIQARASATR